MAKKGQKDSPETKSKRRESIKNNAFCVDWLESRSRLQLKQILAKLSIGRLDLIQELIDNAKAEAKEKEVAALQAEKKRLDAKIQKLLYGAVPNVEAPQAAAKSNKLQVFEAWQAGETDVPALAGIVNNAVKDKTVKGWISGWKNGRNLPKQ